MNSNLFRMQIDRVGLAAKVCVGFYGLINVMPNGLIAYQDILKT